MFRDADCSPLEYAERQIKHFDRELLTQSEVAYRLLDIFERAASSAKEWFDVVPLPVREQLVKIALTHDDEYYLSRFSILTDPVGTYVKRVEVTQGDPDQITVHISHGNASPEPYDVDASHPFRVSIESLRDFLSVRPTPRYRTEPLHIHDVRLPESCSTPSTVVEIRVSVGQRVWPDSEMVGLRDDSGYHRLPVGDKGRVTEILVQPNQRVATGQTIIRVEHDPWFTPLRPHNLCPRCNGVPTDHHKDFNLEYSFQSRCDKCEVGLHRKYTSAAWSLNNQTR